MVFWAGVRLRESRDLCDPAIRAQCACAAHRAGERGWCLRADTRRGEDGDIQLFGLNHKWLDEETEQKKVTNRRTRQDPE